MKTKVDLSERLLRAERVAITTDAWTSCASDSYVHYSVYYYKFGLRVRELCIADESFYRDLCILIFIFFISLLSIWLQFVPLGNTQISISEIYLSISKVFRSYCIQIVPVTQWLHGSCMC